MKPITNLSNFNFVLQNLYLKSFNDIQEASLLENRENDNVILLAPTGSGKTLAFLLPLLDKINKEEKSTQVIIVVPTRELAIQIEQVFTKIKTGLKLTCCYGGHKREIEENSLTEAPYVIVGTPGRLGDHIRRGNINCETVHTLVLDEFDKILEAGFEEETAFVTNSLTNLQKRILTSATNIESLPSFLNNYVFVKLDFVKNAQPLSIEHYYLQSTDIEKTDTLHKILSSLGDKKIIVFCNMRDTVEHITFQMQAKGIPAVFYHGQMEQRDREIALFKFRSGAANALITTDIASRGLDIEYVRYIIHYDLPETHAIYTHRVGRSARMKEFGTSIAILSPEEHKDDYFDLDVKEYSINPSLESPEQAKWVLLYMPLGKKNKVNKVDIVGFILKNGGLKPDDLGLIEVKDFMSFIAVRKGKAAHLLHVLNNEKIKNKKPKISILK